MTQNVECPAQCLAREIYLMHVAGGQGVVEGNQLNLSFTVYLGLEEIKTFELKPGPRKQLCFPFVASRVWGVLGSPWSLACSEVTPGCVETTLAKCHGNEPGCHPHRAQRERQFQKEQLAARAKSTNSQSKQRG